MDDDWGYPHFRKHPYCCCCCCGGGGGGGGGGHHHSKHSNIDESLTGRSGSTCTEASPAVHH